MSTVVDRNEALAVDAENSGYTEHAKLYRLNGKNQVVQGFLDWLFEEANYCVCEWVDEHVVRDEYGRAWIPEGHYPVSENREKLMARFFDIDLDKLSAEKDAMIRDLIGAGGASR